MTRKTLIFVLLFLFATIPVYAQSNEDGYVEVYDLQLDKITKTIPVSEEILTKAERYLTNIDELYKKFKPMPQKGKLIRIPFNSSIHIKNKWVTSSIQEVIFIIPENDSSLLLVFDEEKTPFFFTFTENIDELLAEIDDTAE
ncbi:hypothetical protein JCM9140_1171 [Halalkalibacter wakoensis JCM 9140]|uniref:DUF3887 domain-containing protein n=1 Tax=Halalkalibacter wakoensis JCM 9140 TaxID=1236970 RepID=W4PZC6_9BACI|nr:hypothetical protein [Halalkalibacter wakoensis]GAE25191.1 hypothetical protein JCM9140_1171 [Halalkalibacter wakoensis JCM 9140]